MSAWGGQKKLGGPFSSQLKKSGVSHGHYATLKAARVEKANHFPKLLDVPPLLQKSRKSAVIAYKNVIGRKKPTFDDLKKMKTAR